MVATPTSTPTVFQGIAEPTRRQILVLLRDGERPVAALQAAFPVTASAISQHLRVLKDAGLVTDRRDGRTRHYALVPEALREVSTWMQHFDRFWDDRLARLEQYLERDGEAVTAAKPPSRKRRNAR